MLCLNRLLKTAFGWELAGRANSSFQRDRELHCVWLWRTDRKRTAPNSQMSKWAISTNSDIRHWVHRNTSSTDTDCFWSYDSPLLVLIPCFSLCAQFAGFSSESLCERIMDAQSSVLVTAGTVYLLKFHRRKTSSAWMWSDVAKAPINDSFDAFFPLCVPHLHHTQMVFTEERSWSTWSRFQMRLWRSVEKSKSISQQPCLHRVAEDPAFTAWVTTNTLFSQLLSERIKEHISGLLDY